MKLVIIVVLFFVIVGVFVAALILTVPKPSFNAVTVPSTAVAASPYCSWVNTTSGSGNPVNHDRYCLWVTGGPTTGGIYTLQGTLDHGTGTTVFNIPALTGTAGQKIGWQAPDSTGSLEFQPAYTVLLFPYVAACTLNSGC